MCRDPKTSFTVIDTMRSQVLTCLASSGALDTDTIDTLELHWDLLGTERICMFVDKLMSASPDKRLVSDGGPYAFISGMIASLQISQKNLVKEMLEMQANVSADLTLASRSIKTFQSSMTDAEKIWRAQSSLCSDYMAKVESHLKKLHLNIETATARETTPQPSPSEASTPENISYPPYEYYWKEGRFHIRCYGDPTPEGKRITNQVSSILSAVRDTRGLIALHPEYMYKSFMKEFTTNGKDPVKAVESILKMVDRK